MSYELIDIAKISTLESNPRKDFNQVALDELSASIDAHGIIQPLVVRPNPELPEFYELVAGERRWRCATKLGLIDVPCMVRDLNDLEVAEIQLIENIDRHGLSPLEESHGVCRLVDLGVDPHHLAERLGRADDWVQLRLDLPTLPELAKAAISDGRLGLGGAKQLLRLELDEREEAFQRLLELDGQLTERTVSEVLRNRYHEPRRRRELWRKLGPAMENKFSDRSKPVDDVETSYEYVRAWGAGIGHYVNTDDEVGGLSRHPVESVVTWGELAQQHDIETLLVCAGGEISLEAVVEVIDRRMVIDAERALRDQGKSHTLGPRKVRLSEEDLQEPEELGETDDEFIVRHLMVALELRYQDEELREALMPVLDLIAERTL